MSAGNDQRKQWEMQVRDERVGEDMPGDMMHRHQRLVIGPGQRLGRMHADMQAADQPRPLRHGDRIDIRYAEIRLFERLFDHHGDVFHMDAAGHFRNDAAKFLMDIDLRRHDAGKDLFSVLHDRNCGLIAAALDPKHDDIFHSSIPPAAHAYTNASSPLS